MTVDQKELAPDIYESVKALSANGDQLDAAGKYDEAIAEYNKAWV